MTAQAQMRVERLDGAGRGVGVDETGARRAVSGALPGEIVQVEAAAESDGDALLRVLEPSGDRVAAPCRHAKACGGCALQHASADFLAEWKRARVVEALSRAGLEAEVAATVSSPPRSRRRVKLSARRGKKGVTLGFYGARSHVIAPIESCLVMRPEIEAAFPALRRLALLAAPRARPIGLWVEISGGGLDIGLEDAKPLDAEATEAAALWAESEDVARLTWNGEPLATRRPPLRTHGGAQVAAPPGAFAQATAEGEAELVSLAVEMLAGARRVADLFAGAGTFSLPLAAQSEVLAVEGDAGLVAALERGWREAAALPDVRLKALKALRRDLFRRPLLPEEMKGLDGALFDPPRAGAEAQARALAAAPAQLRRLVGVSCNPASFARDASLLAEGGWRLRRVTPIDQFLWSPHVELIALFERG